MLDINTIAEEFTKKLKDSEKQINELKEKYSYDKEVQYLISKPAMTFDIAATFATTDIPEEIKELYRSLFKDVVANCSP